MDYPSGFLPPNIDLHLYETREGRWRIRIDGTGLGARVTLGAGAGYETASAALEAAAHIFKGFQRGKECQPS